MTPAIVLRPGPGPQQLIIPWPFGLGVATSATLPYEAPPR